MGAIFEFIAKAFEWLAAAWRPVVGELNKLANSWRDFDVGATTILPSILLVISLALFAHLAWAPQAGLEALVTWAQYDTASAATWLTLLFVAFMAVAGALFLFGHWLLLLIWQLVPLPISSRFEIPLVDHVGLVARLGQARARLYQAYAKAKEPAAKSAVNRALRKLVDPAALPATTRNRASTEALERAMRADLADLRKAAADLHDKAAKLTELNLSDADQPPPDDTASRARKPAGYADSIGASLASLFEGLQPGFARQLKELRNAVRDFQVQLYVAVTRIDEGIQDGLIDVRSFSTFLGHLQVLEALSQDTVSKLAAQFGVAGSMPSADAGAIRFVHMNSLAFNLAGTTLAPYGAPSHWGPVKAWLRGLEAPDSRAAKETQSRLLHGLVDAAEREQRANPAGRLSETLRAANRIQAALRLAAVERSKRALEDARQELTKFKKSDERASSIEHKLREGRSSIVANATMASFLLIIGFALSVAVLAMLGGQGFTMWVMALVAAPCVLALTAIAVFVFIEPIVAHAFYVSVLESSISRELGIRSAARATNWLQRPSGPIARTVGLVALALLIGLPVLGYTAVRTVFGTDHRLVVVAKQPLMPGDGITSRSLADTVGVAWQRCDAAISPYGESSPARLVDTYLVGADGKPVCKKGAVFAATDLVVRPAGPRTGAPALTGSPCRGVRATEADVGAMCRTSINRPTPTKPPLPPGDWPTDERIVAGLTAIAKAIDGISVKIEKMDTKLGIDLPAIQTSLGLLLASFKSTFNGKIQVEIDGFPPPLPPPGGGVTIIAYLPSPAGEPQKVKPSHIGSIYFNFNCDGFDRATHCEPQKEPPEARPAGCKEVGPGRSGADDLAKVLAAFDAVKAPGKDLLVVGWADHAGAFNLNRGLAERRANNVAKRLAEDRKELVNHVHPIGIGEGHPDLDKCDHRRRRVDVYMIQSD